MTTEIKVPVLPESVADATIAAWHKKPGDSVSEGESLVDLETDKVVLEVPAPVDGVLDAIVAQEGETVTAGTVIGSISAGDGKRTAEAAKSEAAPVKVESAPAKAAEAAKPAAKTAASSEPLAGSHDLTPSQRRKAAEQGIDPKTMKQAAPKVTPDVNGRPEERVPMTRLRQRIAERLLDVKQNTAMLTTFNEVNLKAVSDIRNQYKDQFEKQHGIRLGFMSFFTKAAVEALKRFPDVNASIDGTDIVYHGYYDIGIAVSTDRGLMVPILRDVDHMGLADIEKGIKNFADKARDGQITLDDMSGGTFTITNGGAFGSLLSTPIINPPQSAILGMHGIQQRPIAENGQVVIRPMMYLALSYDHRIIDGKQSVLFLRTIKDLLEDPARLLLDI
jgi:2-oxoglutarate dehydrogenase E2 component (dihydrolipoamide succinyltransferase)